ncbi:hypothetical protein AKJ49_00630 [candidate division MSBL1 archaeon SCGC-AAA382A03]|uniref:Uncharacterized protein n=1 Tax=candidate division MSBL1 archaeon SCGC-AAA382A03 TaxID=1698278 RepID=A0A133VGD9_9EURY|nr:hypothetical protein AKJ49_00630 [candidate division MSBL1 archaeon SCGC-AAA382A03]
MPNLQHRKFAAHGRYSIFRSSLLKAKAQRFFGLTVNLVSSDATIASSRIFTLLEPSRIHENGLFVLVYPVPESVTVDADTIVKSLSLPGAYVHARPRRKRIAS